MNFEDRNESNVSERDFVYPNRMFQVILDQISMCLEEMLLLSRRASEASCSDAERAELQQKLVLLRARIDRIVDNPEEELYHF